MNPNRRLFGRTKVPSWLSSGLCAVVVACAACGYGAKPDDQSRFELKQDDKGHTVRLDRATGEVTPIDSGRSKAPSAAGAKATLLPATNRPAAGTQGATAGVKPSVPSDPKSSSVVIAPPRTRGAFPTVAVTTATPIFQTAAANQTPIRIAEPGFMLTYISSDGTWYRVMFDSPNGGRAYGYVSVKPTSVRPSMSPAPEPVDLSIRELKPIQHEPLDPLVPVDLSVPGAK